MEINEFKNAFPKLARRLGAEIFSAHFVTLMHEREVSAGTILIEDQVPAASLYLVLEGEFRVVVPRSDGELEIGRIGSGKSIGETALFTEDHLPTSRVIATTPSRILEIQHAQYWLAWKENPDLASVLTREFIDHMSERVRSADELINDSLQKAVSVSANPLAKPESQGT